MSAHLIRTVAAAILAIVSGLVVAAATVAIYADTTLFDDRAFADRTVAALGDERVRTATAEAITDALVEREPDLIPARPVVRVAADLVLGSDSFRSLFRTSAREAHQAFFTSDGGFVLRLGDIALLVSEVIRSSNPEVAERLPADLGSSLIQVTDRDWSERSIAAAEDVSRLAFWLPALAILAVGLAVALATNRRQAIVVVGLAAGLASGLALVAVDLARDRAIDRFAQRDAAGAVWDAYVADLRGWLVVGAAIAVIGAAAAASLILPVDVPALARQAAERVTRAPARRNLRLARGAIIAIAGLFIALQPATAVRIFTVAAGVLLFFHGATEMLRLVEARARPADVAGARGLFAGVAKATAAFVAIAAVAGMGAWALAGDEGERATAAERVSACNGSAALCDRPVTAVTLAATHNSMSAAKDGFLLAMHDGGIIEQLDAGVRGLLIDTWYGIPARGGLVLTDLPASGTDRDAQIAEYGPAVVAAAERQRARAGLGDDRRTYLCHGFCELGATPLEAELRRIAGWLERNPNEILVIVVQDMISPADTEAAVVASGLIDHVHAQDPGAPYPTLREMIARDRRAIVMAENATGGIPWYAQAYDVTEETPFRAARPADFTCAPARGGTGKPFFLLNHWIERPQPLVSDARRVNARDFLLPRIRECERRRGRLPTLVAVNYWNVGDLVAVVAAVNGVAGTP